MYVTLACGLKFGVISFAEVKFNLENWRKGDFNIGRNDEKRDIFYLSIYLCLSLFISLSLSLSLSLYIYIYIYRINVFMIE